MQSCHSLVLPGVCCPMCCLEYEPSASLEGMVPVVLPCGHSICHRCATSQSSTSSKMTCSEGCGMIGTVRINRELCNIIQKRKDKMSRSASGYADASLHNRDIGASLSCEAQSGADDDKLSAVCASHPGHRMDIWCHTCTQVVCTAMALRAHRLHCLSSTTDAMLETPLVQTLDRRVNMAEMRLDAAIALAKNIVPSKEELKKRAYATIDNMYAQEEAKNKRNRAVSQERVQTAERRFDEMYNLQYMESLKRTLADLQYVMDSTDKEKDRSFYEDIVATMQRATHEAGVVARNVVSESNPLSALAETIEYFHDSSEPRQVTPASSSSSSTPVSSSSSSSSSSQTSSSQPDSAKEKLKLSHLRAASNGIKLH